VGCCTITVFFHELNKNAECKRVNSRHQCRLKPLTLESPLVCGLMH
jgi:hypothetical protein